MQQQFEQFGMGHGSAGGAGGAGGGSQNPSVSQPLPQLRKFTNNPSSASHHNSNSATPTSVTHNPTSLASSFQVTTAGPSGPAAPPYQEVDFFADNFVQAPSTQSANSGIEHNNPSQPWLPKTSGWSNPSGIGPTTTRPFPTGSPSVGGPSSLTSPQPIGLAHPSPSPTGAAKGAQGGVLLPTSYSQQQIDNYPGKRLVATTAPASSAILSSTPSSTPLQPTPLSKGVPTTVSKSGRPDTFSSS